MTGSRHERLANTRLYLIATADRAPAPSPDWLARVRAAVEGGVGAVQLRQKGASTAVRRVWLDQLRDVVGPEVLLLVNDDLGAVHQAHGALLADGLHLGRADAEALGGHGGSHAERRHRGLAHARGALGPELLLGTSTRTAAEITAALAAGADHVGFGAMSVSTTKPGAPPARPEELARCLKRFPGLPIFPIGGVNLATLLAWVTLGARQAAVGSAVLQASDPQASAAALSELFTHNIA